jgi:hypothetical protein
MIALVKSIQAQVGEPDYLKVQGWAQIPPSDPNLPVPRLNENLFSFPASYK